MESGSKCHTKSNHCVLCKTRRFSVVSSLRPTNMTQRNPPMNVFHELQLARPHSPGHRRRFGQRLDKEKLPMYIGFDPTATSFHAGSLIPLMTLRHFQRCGHQVIVLIGGATGLIGDPSGKSAETNLETRETSMPAAKPMRRQIEGFLATRTDRPRSSSTHRLARRIPAPRFPARTSANTSPSRNDPQGFREETLRQGRAGISYTEFTYMLLQATDFLELYRRHGCKIQCGASDQWGTSVEGMATDSPH